MTHILHQHTSDANRVSPPIVTERKTHMGFEVKKNTNMFFTNDIIWKSEIHVFLWHFFAGKQRGQVCRRIESHGGGGGGEPRGASEQAECPEELRRLYAIVRNFTHTVSIGILKNAFQVIELSATNKTKDTSMLAPVISHMIYWRKTNLKRLNYACSTSHFSYEFEQKHGIKILSSLLQCHFLSCCGSEYFLLTQMQ